MKRRGKSEYKRKNDILDFVIGVVGLYVIYLLLLFYTDRVNFWRWVIYGFGGALSLILLSFLWGKTRETLYRKRLDSILDSVRKAGLDKEVENFISRFGLGQEKGKDEWSKGSYKFRSDRISSLHEFLEQRGLSVSLSDVENLLTYYIHEKEYGFVSSSISVGTQHFSNLSGQEFERLLCRLYESMGYSVNINGGVGDQGGDLIATKGQERVLIQAKRYTNSVGNDAVQQANTARTYYNCNRAIVMASNVFTKEAMQLAPKVGVELISRDSLQRMLLDYLKESWD
ncbi:MAG: restriction endonuclease [Candidatus Liptonbacteria bacterium]